MVHLNLKYLIWFIVHHIFFHKIWVCGRICGASKFDYILNKCGQFCVGFASHSKGFLSPVSYRWAQGLIYVSAWVLRWLELVGLLERISLRMKTSNNENHKVSMGWEMRWVATGLTILADMVNWVMQSSTAEALVMPRSSLVQFFAEILEPWTGLLVRFSNFGLNLCLIW
jgi:hypothetical protein